MIARILIALVALVLFPCAVSAAITLPNVAGTSCSSGSTCAVTVASNVGDTVLAYCNAQGPTSGSEGTPSFTGATSLITTAEWAYDPSPYFHIFNLSSIAGGAGSTTATCTTTGTCNYCFVAAFDFRGVAFIDCATVTINLADSSSQTTASIPPSTTGDYAFAFTTYDRPTPPTLSLTGGGSPSCPNSTIPSNTAAAYCAAQLTSATALTAGATAPNNGASYALGLVILAPTASSFNPTFSTPAGMVGIR